MFFLILGDIKMYLRKMEMIYTKKFTVSKKKFPQAVVVDGVLSNLFSIEIGNMKKKTKNVSYVHV